ncbi:MAG TPA: peptidoglycan-binding protein LysM [Burkholderiaceae bacterium]|nr:peptidoglycan-binding protein LysM [Burkholderiaceae bacterium]
MGLLNFVKEAGEKLFGRAEAQPTAAPEAGAPNLDALNTTASNAIRQYLGTLGLPSDGVNVAYDGASQTVTLTGSVPDQATREKIVLAAGNVANVAAVQDQLNVTQPAASPAQYYTVAKGDTLSKIAKQFYGDPNKYTRIFEANKPMLSDPDKIYPGQTLRIVPA